LLRFNFREHCHRVSRMNLWILTPFQMLHSMFRRKSFQTLLLSPLLLLMILLFPSLLILKKRHLPNLREMLI
jgi:hypothetical protein